MGISFVELRFYLSILGFCLWLVLLSTDDPSSAGVGVGVGVDLGLSRNTIAPMEHHDLVNIRQCMQSLLTHVLSLKNLT